MTSGGQIALESAPADLAPNISSTSPMLTAPASSYEELGRAALVPREGRGALVTRALLVADTVALSCAYAVAVGVEAAAADRDGGTLTALLAAPPLMLLGARLSGLYGRDEQRPDHSTLDELAGLFQLATAGTWLAVLLGWAVAGHVALAPAAAFWVASAACLTVARSVARASARRSPAYTQKTLIVGAGEVGQLVARKLLHHPEFGLQVVGFVDATPRELRSGIDGLPVLGAPADAAHIVRAYDVDRVVVAFSNDRHDVLVPLLRSLRDLSVQVDFVPRLFEAVGPVASVQLVEGLPLVSLPPMRTSRLARRAKRVADAAIAASILLVTFPLLAWIAWRIKRDSPGPVLFRQTRLGEGQKPFTLLKFRTMSVGTDAEPHREYVRAIMDVNASPSANNLFKLDRSKDVTQVGAWLRRASLDELPQLVNVVRGDMSLVGPRPCLAYETELFEPHHFDRFLVPAGMTGLWQVTARAHSTFKEALDLDASYARSWSLRLDATLLVRTPLALLRGKATR
jgi:exopolysaccharide biosynthesis polyprenyl glycosylphosphotransferase